MTVVAYNQRDIAGIMAMIRQLGALVGCPDKADELASNYEQRLDTLKNSGNRKQRSLVYFEGWDDPMISGIHWISELIEVARGQGVFPQIACESKANNHIVSSEQVIEAQPDVIIASWCGKKFLPEKIARRPGWDAIPAVRNGRIIEIKSSLILQPGPAALTDGLNAIVDALNFKQ